MTFLDRKHALAAGFSLLELAMGIVFLALVFVGLSAYSGSQWKALKKSGNLTEAAQVGITTLENDLVSLGDSATFATTYLATASAPKISNSTVAGIKDTFTVVLTRSHLAGSNNLLVVKAAISWPGGHSAKIGMLAVKP